jgi:hypothetical protein
MTDSAADPSGSPAGAAADDPLLGAKLGARDLLERLIEALRDDRGVHAESLLTLLGAMAGLATQASLRERALAAGLPELSPFQVVRLEAAGEAGAEGEAGEAFLTGDRLLRALAAEPLSLWDLAAAEAQSLGCLPLPDREPLIAWGVAQLGRGDDYGRPDVPEKHQPRPGSLASALEIWPLLRDLLRSACPDPAQWPALTGLAAQDALRRTAAVVDPCVGLQLLMQAAIAAAKLPLPPQST